MDAWAETSGAAQVLFSKESTLSNPIFEHILDAKAQLKTARAVLDVTQDSEKSALTELFSAICDGDFVAVEAALTTDESLTDSFLPGEQNGFTPLIFAVVFGQPTIAESLLKSHQANPNLFDSSNTQYTPLMWAVTSKDVSMVALLLEYDADPHLSPKSNGVNAISLASTSSPEIKDYFSIHNLNQFSSSPNETELYGLNSFGPGDDNLDDLSYKIRMQTLAANPSPESSDSEENMSDENELAADTVLIQLPEFDYKKVLPDQFIKFSDSDIPSLLDYIFELRTKYSIYQNTTQVPAAVIFQLLHYSHNKVDSRDLTEFTFECFITRLRSVTNTKSGVFNMALTTSDSNDKKSPGGAGDIVLLSYWLSVVQFLHFYFAKGEFYLAYPKFLQELVNITQSLIATLSFSINSRLNLLTDDCMLNFTSLVDVSSVLYAKDWNLFKSQKKHPNTYDDIMKMLYPPSLNELMKPSPLKYVQVLGALHYVLDLHSVDPLLRIQTFSQVFYYINATIFNRLISNSKYCSRVKAIQIRLNISTLEDWLRSHNFRAHKPDNVGGLELLLNQDERSQLKLSSLHVDSDNLDDPSSLLFYYKSLFHIGRSQLQPTIEFLQWLQVMSGIRDEESLVNTINEFERLNYYQLSKTASKLYRYEVEERKFPKSLANFLKRLVAEQGEVQISKSKMHYMTQSTFLSKEVYIYLNPNHIYAVALPNLNELIMNYGAGLGGVKRLRAKKYQPSIPMAVSDDVEEILSQNRANNVNDTYDYENEEVNVESKEENSANVNESESEQIHLKDEKTFKGDELFKHIQAPSTLAHKHWGSEEFESNPW